MQKLKIKITRAYYVAVEDSSGKELTSDFTFLNKDEAKKIGERMKNATHIDHIGTLNL